MSLYAQIDRETNQMIGSPAKLPRRLTTAGGAVIADFNKLSDTVLQAFDWLPVTYEELMGGSILSSTPFFDAAAQRFVYEAIPQDTGILIEQADRRINEAASFASAKYRSQGIGQESRYMLKREQAINFLLDSDPDLSDYPMLSYEAEAAGVNIRDIAQLISDNAAAWLEIASKIEAARCGGRKKCREAANGFEIVQRRDEAIAVLELI